MVPAVVVPEGFPKPSVFDVLSEHFASAPRGSALTAEYDWSDEWKSYHDLRPKECRVGVDLYIAPDSAVQTSATATTALAAGGGFNSASTDVGDVASTMARNNRISIPTVGGADDAHARTTSRMRVRESSLDAIVAKQVMDALLSDPQLKQFAFMGRDLARYVGDRLAVEDDRYTAAADMFAARFDFERWRKRGQGTSCVCVCVCVCVYLIVAVVGGGGIHLRYFLLRYSVLAIFKTR